MQAHILSLHTLRPQGLGLNGNFLTESIVMLHIKLKGMVQRATSSTYSVLTHTRGSFFFTFQGIWAIIAKKLDSS